jgi:pyruvate dehydrogenase E1 component
VIAATDYVATSPSRSGPGCRAATRARHRWLRPLDTREKLRHFFEVDRYWITLAALTALAEEGAVKKEKVAEAIKKYGLDPNKPNPAKV